MNLIHSVDGVEQLGSGLLHPSMPLTHFRAFFCEWVSNPNLLCFRTVGFYPHDLRQSEAAKNGKIRFSELQVGTLIARHCELETILLWTGNYSIVNWNSIAGSFWKKSNWAYFSSSKTVYGTPFIQSYADYSYASYLLSKHIPTWGTFLPHTHLLCKHFTYYLYGHLYASPANARTSPHRLQSPSQGYSRELSDLPRWARNFFY